MDGEKKKKRRGPKWCLIPPCGNDGTYVTQMTVSDRPICAAAGAL